ncbi:MAG: aspartate aminotransferase family protein [Acidimicrobiales bacterium]|jgi:4-aminobutyrate aminotransferase|nr:aspartate aminotransferase family protein [Acidimicrobiales bacterium]MEC9113894.1 aspartate aminotransferase family protein [Actinomycetota bacterium]|tara:strand:+ start:43 stop:1335 length:1293 start_codon:yes stop_codon:yes gene_type:complete
MANTQELLERYRAVMPSFVNPLYESPISIDYGKGSYVWDLEGNQYLDFFGGILTTMIGHSVPEVVSAVQDQAAKVMHTSTLYLNEQVVSFAEEVAAISGIPDARVLFTTSGSEANDTAILLATNYRQSNQLLAMRNSYHGRSLTAQAVTSHRSWLTSSYSGLDVHFVQGPYRLRSPFRELEDEAFTQACVSDLVQLLDMTDAGGFAALIAEPIQGVGGFATPPDGFFGAMHKVLAANDILFISDEVQTGWGRTGDHFWGYEAHGITPDILTFAKGVGNGITLAGCVARAEVMNVLDRTSFTTFGGNPLSVAAGRATLKFVKDHDLQSNAAARGQQMTEMLTGACDTTDWVGELRGKGLMQAIECVQPGSVEPNAAAATQLIEVCKDHGLLVGKGGLYGNVIRLTPMLNVSEEEMSEGCEIIVSALNSVTG